MGVVKYAYYNEIEPYPAEWIRRLIRAGCIAPGYVDERSILDVSPDDLREFGQCHFFAGLGGWSLALRLAGVSDEEPVWTGSCPCQPFSGAGKGGGFADERHLWPAFHWLVAQRRPHLCFGEQVEGPAGRAWLDLVQTDLEGIGYASGAHVFPAASVGAPHGRHRTYWVADATARRRGARLNDDDAARHELYDAWRGSPRGVAEPDEGQRRRIAEHGELLGHGQARGWFEGDGEPAGRGGTVVMADDDAGLERWSGAAERRVERAAGPAGVAGVLADADFGAGRQGDSLNGRRDRRSDALEGSGFSGGGDTHRFGPGAVDRPWRDADWLLCRDGKWRPVEPGTQPLATGIPARVGKLRAYGNSIVPQAAAEFVKAYLDATRTVEADLRPVRVNDLFG